MAGRVELSGIKLGKRDREERAALLAAAERAGLSYDHVGSTIEGRPPTTVPERTFTCEVAGSLASAAAALRAWAPHRGIAATIEPADAPLEVGTSLLVIAPWGPFELAAPDRIVSVIDEPERFGFAYGTLGGHAEVGEELFLTEVIAPGGLRLTVRVHAGPATLLTRIGSPLLSFLQGAAAKRYLAAWAAAIEPGEP
jgi:uncharacterized protein (UPF0548 family)